MIGSALGRRSVATPRSRESKRGRPAPPSPVAAAELLPVIVIDGREFTWEEFGRLLLSFEGWQFCMEIIDPTDEA